jgi:hypothetical protein
VSTGVEREMKLDLNKNAAAQDMIRIIMRDKSMLPDEAVKFAINRQMHQKILQEGYASIAFDLWGHDNPEREWDKLDNPIIEVDLDKLSTRLVEDIMEKEDVSAELAVCYFLIFTMDYLGYHI